MPIANAHMTPESHIMPNRMKKICEFLGFAHKSHRRRKRWAVETHMYEFEYTVKPKTSSCIRNAAFSHSGLHGWWPGAGKCACKCFVFLHLSTCTGILSCSETMETISFEKSMSWFSFVLFYFFWTQKLFQFFTVYSYRDVWCVLPFSVAGIATRMMYALVRIVRRMPRICMPETQTYSSCETSTNNNNDQWSNEILAATQEQQQQQQQKNKRKSNE